MPVAELLKNELDSYLRLKTTEKGVQDVGCPQKWWKMQRATFPHLTSKACKYFSVQATSASSVRKFSKVGNIVIAKSNHISSDSADDLVVLHSAKRYCGARPHNV
ncbi:unnamed protein product [Discosporangium mesarthrocarpum]